MMLKGIATLATALSLYVSAPAADKAPTVFFGLDYGFPWELDFSVGAAHKNTILRAYNSLPQPMEWPWKDYNKIVQHSFGIGITQMCLKSAIDKSDSNNFCGIGLDYKQTDVMENNKEKTWSDLSLFFRLNGYYNKARFHFDFGTNLSLNGLATTLYCKSGVELHWSLGK